MAKQSETERNGDQFAVPPRVYLYQFISPPLTVFGIISLGLCSTAAALMSVQCLYFATQFISRSHSAPAACVRSLSPTDFVTGDLHF